MPMSNSEARKREQASETTHLKRSPTNAQRLTDATGRLERDQPGPERWMHWDPTTRALIAEARQDAFAQGYEAGLKHARIIADAALDGE